MMVAWTQGSTSDDREAQELLRKQRIGGLDVEDEDKDGTDNNA